jgi:hypothetical protein
MVWMNSTKEAIQRLEELLDTSAPAPKKLDPRDREALKHVLDMLKLFGISKPSGPNSATEIESNPSSGIVEHYDPASGTRWIANDFR